MRAAEKAALDALRAWHALYRNGRKPRVDMLDAEKRLAAAAQAVPADPDPFEAVMRQLGEEEQAVILMLAKRLLLGQEQYGKLHLETDRRDWRRERAAETQDWLIYLMFEDFKKSIK